MGLSSEAEKAADSITSAPFHGSSQFLPDLNKDYITSARPQSCFSLLPSNRVIKVGEVDLSYSKPANTTSDSESRSCSKHCDWDPDRYRRPQPRCRDEAGNLYRDETSSLYRNEMGNTTRNETSSLPNFVQSDPPIGKGQPVCPYPGCGRAFGRVGDLKRHERQHNPEKEFSCPDCDYQSHRRDHLTQHKRKKHKAQETETIYSESDFRVGKRSNSTRKNLVTNRRANAGMAIPFYAVDDLHVPGSPGLEFDVQEAQDLDLLQTNKAQAPILDNVRTMDTEEETSQKLSQPSRGTQRTKQTQVTGNQLVGPAMNAFALGIRSSPMDYWRSPTLNERDNARNTRQSLRTKR